MSFCKSKIWGWKGGFSTVIQTFVHKFSTVWLEIFIFVNPYILYCISVITDTLPPNRYIYILELFGRVFELNNLKKEGLDVLGTRHKYQRELTRNTGFEMILLASDFWTNDRMFNFATKSSECASQQTNNSFDCNIKMTIFVLTSYLSISL